MAEPYASYRMLARRAWLILRARVWQLRRWWRRYRADVLPARLPTILHYESGWTKPKSTHASSNLMHMAVEPVRRAVQYKADIAGLLYDTPAIPADLVGLSHCPTCARHVREARIEIRQEITQFGRLVYAFADCPNGHRSVRKIGVYTASDARRERPDEWLRRMLGPFPTRTGYRGPPPLLGQPACAAAGRPCHDHCACPSVRPTWDSSGDGRSGS